MSMAYKSYKKGEIATRMLETALDLYFDGGDGFAIIHLAANAEEVLAGFIQKNKTKENISETICTARDKAKSALKEIHAIHGQERSKDEIGIFLNFVRNKTKHRGTKSDSDEIAVCLELEVEFAISSAIENYILFFKVPTEKMLRYINKTSQRSFA